MYNWRYVFYINLPFGLLATLGLLLFMHETDSERHLRFDWLGFVVLGTGIGALQMMLDRGNNQDWFTSREIIIEAVLGSLCIYLFLVHMAWAPRPLIRPVLFRDVNFSVGLVLMFSVGTLLVSSIALMAPWLQTLANYPVATAGLLMAPRGIGNLFTIVLGGRLVSRARSALAGGDRTGDAVLVILGDDRLDTGRVGARAGHHHRGAGRRAGSGVHVVAGAGLRHACAQPAHRGCGAVQPGPQHRRGDRRVGDDLAARAQFPGAA